MGIREGLCRLSSISITEASHADRVEHLSRLLARRVALGLALSRGEMVAAARAAGRTRLPELGLTAGERNAARFVRATLGRAIRDARARTVRPLAVRPVFKSEAAVAAKRSPRRLAVAAALVTVIVLFIGVLFLGQPGGPLTGIRSAGNAGAANAQQVLDATKQSRGRTSKFTQQVAVGAPTAPPAATRNPVYTLEDMDNAHSGGGGGGGGSGGGSGSGGVGVVPLPPVVPGPTPIPSGYVRFHGRVFDATTGAPVQGVCIVIGSLNCDTNKPHTDAQGYWEVTVTAQPFWDFGWQLTGFRSYAERLYSFGRNDVEVRDLRLSH